MATAPCKRRHPTNDDTLQTQSIHTAGQRFNLERALLSEVASADGRNLRSSPPRLERGAAAAAAEPVLDRAAPRA